MVRCRGNPGDSRDTRFRKKENRQMGRRTVINASWSAAVVVVVWVNPIGAEAQVLNELIGGARKEPEVAFTAGPSSFQQKVRTECADQFYGETDHAGDGRPNHHRSQSGQKIIHRRPPGPAGDSSRAPQRRVIGASRLFEPISLGDEGNGDSPRGDGASLYFAARDLIQL